MATALLYFLLIATALAALRRAWVGVAAYYTLSIWYPQLIWYWAFGTLRTSLIVSLVTLVGFGKDLFLGRIDFSVLKQKQNYLVIILWLTLAVSYFFGAYGQNTYQQGPLNSNYLMSYFNRVFFFYFIAILLINDRHKYSYLLIVVPAVVVFYTYWANDHYFTIGLGANGRLSGPGPEAWESTGIGGGPYTDENTFAMLFVMGVPFLWYMGRYYRSKIVKWFLWGCIPFAWHAVFLTGSFGGMIGLGAVTMYMTFRSRNRFVLVVFPILLAAAFLWQGGPYLKQKIMGTGGDVTQVGTAQQRFDSWEAGVLMVLDHPVTGVGLGNFLKAYPDYSDTQPHVAHNTFLQFAAESGLVAGIVYLLFFLNLIVEYWKETRKVPPETDQFVVAARESIVASMLGFFVCGVFLNLALYEMFYYVLILNVVHQRLFRHSNPAFERTKVTEAFA